MDIEALKCEIGPLWDWNEELGVRWEHVRAFLLWFISTCLSRTMNTGLNNCLGDSSISIAVDLRLIPISSSHFIYYEQ